MVRSAPAGQGTAGTPADLTADGQSEVSVPRVSDWDLLRSYVHGPGSALALIEIESAAQADDVVAAVRVIAAPNPVSVFRATSGDDYRSVLDWLESVEPHCVGGLCLIADVEKWCTEPQSTREFWTWMNLQRERWKRDDLKVAFLLVPSQVDALARYAPMLWEWIPLKLNLLGRESLGDRMGVAANVPPIPGPAPKDAADLLPALRQQLLRAREAGLPEPVIRRDYAWPLFRNLVYAQHLSEAREVLEADLTDDSLNDWSAPAAHEACLLIGWLYVLIGDTNLAARWTERSLSLIGNDPRRSAETCHQLGIVAQRRRDFNTAEEWYRKSLAIKETQGDEYGAAITYHQLGMIAELRRDFNTAEEWYRKSLAIKEKQGDEHGAAITYHQLGRIAQERRDFNTAEEWYRKSLAIKETQGDEHGAAITYHQLGMIAELRRDFNTAEEWYRKSLEIEMKQGDEQGAASTYHQLGMIAEEARDFNTAEEWYRKSLAIKEKQGNEHGAAITYHQLGRIAEERMDFSTAEKWCRKSLAITEQQGDEHGAAITYHQLGMIAQERMDFNTAEEWYRKSLAIKEKQGNEHGAGITNLAQARLAMLQTDHVSAARKALTARRLFGKTLDPRREAGAANLFKTAYESAASDAKPTIRSLWDENADGPFPDSPGDALSSAANA
jgi:tetratricopeptide (TPR) repeat protein